MQARIAQSVQSDEHRQEVSRMGKTIAEMFEEKGRNEERLTSRRDTLLRLIRLKFGDPPADVLATIQACSDPSQLDAWIDGIVTARRLADLGIRSRA